MLSKIYPALIHRYSFNDLAVMDSVGGSAFSGSLLPGAALANGHVSFGSSQAYVMLPRNLFGTSAAGVSIELWVTTTPTEAYYAKIFQIGGSASYPYYDSVALGRDANTGRIVLEYWALSGDYAAGESIQFNAMSNMHCVVVLPLHGFPQLYLNGALAVTLQTTLQALPSQNFAYLGQTTWSGGNMGLQGSIDEFRVWQGALSASDIHLNFLAGKGNASAGVVMSPIINYFIN